MKNALYLSLLILILGGCSGFRAALGIGGGPLVNSPRVQMAWETGSPTVGQQGVYGILGVASATNAPGARMWAAAASDNSGHLWVFGGSGLDGGTASNGQRSGGDMNDLWMYSAASRQWTWVSGSNMAGQAQTATIPGARHGGVAWCDQNGNFWLFGGVQGTSSLNDFWQYNISTGQWTSFSPATAPGGRLWAVAWTDSVGNFWLFGGQAGTIQNDLWKYTVNTNQWIQVTGSATTMAAGVYGTRGVASATNSPGARRAAVGWSDAAGNLWLFGGDGADSTGTIQMLNDLWKFDPVSEAWTWMSGSETAGASGVYGTLSLGRPGDTPGGRMGAYTWTDTAGHLWLFGGQGNDSTTNPNINALNDLWMFSPSSGSWVWVAGSNLGDQQGKYGALGALSSANIPGARKWGSAMTDPSGNLWLFGGAGFDSQGTYQVLNDTWRIHFP